MKRFSIRLARSREEEASVARFQLQTDEGPVSRPELNDPDATETLAPLAPMDSGAAESQS